MENTSEGPTLPPLPTYPKKRAAFDIDRIHPDDAKDKVFIGIIKALIKMDNKPSSPKELAGFIIKHKLAVLGGATPYATVSSRISQHFKRAAEHKPARKPLLAKSFDAQHTRKIRYCLDLDQGNGNDSEGSQSSSINRNQDAMSGLFKSNLNSVPSSSNSIRSRSITRESSPFEDSSLEVIEVESGEEEEEEEEDLDVSTTKDTLSKDMNNLTNIQNIPNDNQPQIQEITKPSKPPSPKQLPPPPPLSVKPQPKTVELSNPIRTPLSTNNPFVYNFLNSQRLKVSNNSKSTLKFSSQYKSKPTSPKPFVASTSLINSVNGFNGVVIEQATNPSPSVKLETTKSPRMLFPPQPTLPTSVNIPVTEDGKRTLSPPLALSPYINLKTPASSNNFLQDTLSPRTSALFDHDLKTIPDISFKMGATNTQSSTNYRGNSSFLLPQLKDPLNVSTSDLDQFFESISLPKQPSNSTNGFNNKHISPRPPHPLRKDTTATSPSKSKLKVSSNPLTSTTKSPLFSAFAGSKKPFNSTELDASQALLHLPISPQFNAFDSSSNPKPPSNTPDRKSSPPPYFSIDDFLASPSLTGFKGVMDVDYNYLLPVPTEQDNTQFDPIIPGESWGSCGIFITLADNLPIFAARFTRNPLPTISKGEENTHAESNSSNSSNLNHVLLTRWIDSDYVNATTLLEAGGVTTKEEQSIILSLEQSCIQINKAESALHGTWIPLHRARALATTCNLNQKLGAFLDQDLDKLFPKPLPLDPAKLPASCIPSLILKGCLDATKCPKIPYHYSAHLRFRPIPLVQLPPNILEQEILIVNNRDREVGGIDLAQHALETVNNVESLNPRNFGLENKKEPDVSMTTPQSSYGGSGESKPFFKTEEYIEDEDEEINIDEDEDVDIGGSDMEDDLR